MRGGKRKLTEVNLGQHFLKCLGDLGMFHFASRHLQFPCSWYNLPKHLPHFRKQNWDILNCLPQMRSLLVLCLAVVVFSSMVMTRKLHTTMSQSIVQLGPTPFQGRIKPSPYRATLRVQQVDMRSFHSSLFSSIWKSTSGFETLEVKEDIKKHETSQQKAIKIIRTKAH